MSGQNEGLLPARLDVSLRKDGVEVEDGDNARTCVLTVKRNDYGLWQLVYPNGSPPASLLLNALTAGEDLGRYGVVFRQPGEEAILESGPLTTVIAVDGRKNGVASDAVSAWGVTDTTHLREKIAFPDPTADINVWTTGLGHTWSSFTRTKTGPLETIFLDFVRENLGEDALVRRRLRDFTLTVPASLGRGGTGSVTVTANTNLLDIAQLTLGVAGLSFRLVQTGPNAMAVQVWEPQVREGIVWFVGQEGVSGTATGVAVKSQRRPKTSVIASGSGDDATTVYVRRAAAVPPGGLSEDREEFIKASGSDPVELSLKADEELIEDGPELGLDIEPDPAAPWRLGIDYDMGDSVVAMIGDTPVEVPILQTILRHEEGTLVEEPSAGFADDEDLTPTLDLIFRNLRRLNERST